MPAATTATHTVLYRLGRPARVTPLSDWQELADMRAATSLSIGIYTVAHVDAATAQAAEDAISGARAAREVIASPMWQAAIAA